MIRTTRDRPQQQEVLGNDKDFSPVEPGGMPSAGDMISLSAGSTVMADHGRATNKTTLGIGML